jgi:hypothetical protein
METLDTIFTWFCWGMMLYSILGFIARYRREKELGIQLRESLDKKIRVIRLETHENLLLAFDGENHEFLAQGLTEEELKQRIMKRFPEKIFLMNEKPFSALEINIPEKL